MKIIPTLSALALAALASNASADLISYDLIFIRPCSSSLSQ